MNARPFKGFVALIVIPCLLADPSFAHALTFQPLSRTNIPQNLSQSGLFSQQALANKALGERQPLRLWAPSTRQLITWGHLAATFFLTTEYLNAAIKHPQAKHILVQQI